jgi:ACT domain-containing protein
LHLVEGVNASEAIRRCGISRAGFYRAKESIGQASVAVATRQVTYTVPVHRLEALNQRVSWQLDNWAKEDALAAQPVDPNNAAPKGNAGVTTGDQT